MQTSKLPELGVLKMTDMLMTTPTPEAIEAARKLPAGASLATLDNVGALIDGMGLSVRMNVITGEIEVTGLRGDYDSHSAALERLLIDVVDMAGSLRMKGSADMISQRLGSIAYQRRFNPVLDWLDNGTSWDGIDRYPNIYEALGITGTERAFDRILVQKWLWQCVALLHNGTAGRKFQPEGCLVLQGEQGTGKTTFFRTLAVRRDWFKEGLSIDTRNKDDLMKATTCWIGELGELDSTLKREQSSLKAFITSESDEYRAPYARTATKKPRRASFCGTVNPEDYLRDETGARRFWTVHVEHIDLKAVLGWDEAFLRQLWLQVRTDWETAPDGYRLNEAERRELERRNAKFARPLKWELEILDLFDFDLPAEAWREVTPAELARHVQGGRADAVSVGRALRHIGQTYPGVTQAASHVSGRKWRVPLKSVYC